MALMRRPSGNIIRSERPLESAACALCCENDADLEGIRNALKVAEESLKEGDSSNFADYNQSFHYEIWKASGNKKIQKMLAELWNGLSTGQSLRWRSMHIVHTRNIKTSLRPLKSGMPDK